MLIFGHSHYAISVKRHAFSAPRSYSQTFKRDFGYMDTSRIRTLFWYPTECRYTPSWLYSGISLQIWADGHLYVLIFTHITVHSSRWGHPSVHVSTCIQLSQKRNTIRHRCEGSTVKYWFSQAKSQHSLRSGLISFLCLCLVPHNNNHRFVQTYANNGYEQLSDK